MKILFAIRTHYINSFVISEMQKLMSSMNENESAILFIDNHTNLLNIKESNNPKQSLKLENLDVNCFIYDKNIHDELRLPYYSHQGKTDDLGQIMWHCSDYPFYMMRKYYPEYDYYWQIEADVFFNGNSYRPFIDKYNNENDLIINQYREIVKEADFFWKDHAKWIYKDVTKYAGFFPVVRLSGKAIDFLYPKRLEHAAIFNDCINDPTNMWLHCEVFVPTELSNNGFKCQNMSGENLRFLPIYKLNEEKNFKKPDNQLYHPVK